MRMPCRQNRPNTNGIGYAREVPTSIGHSERGSSVGNCDCTFAVWKLRVRRRQYGAAATEPAERRKDSCARHGRAWSCARAGSRPRKLARNMGTGRPQIARSFRVMPYISPGSAKHRGRTWSLRTCQRNSLMNGGFRAAGSLPQMSEKLAVQA